MYFTFTFSFHIILLDHQRKRRNNVKARTTLLLALLDEHQLRFSKYETAQELWGAILKIFDGNAATKKTKKNQLKQQYGNFKAEGSETLKQTFNRLQAIVSHLEFIDVEIKQDDLNQKFLTSLAPYWLMHTIVDDLDTMSLDDVYNHLKVYEPEVQKKSKLNSQNMTFISSANTSSGKGKVHIASVPTASTQVSIASDDVVAASISHDTTGKKITIQGTDVAGFDKSNVECFNFHKLGHFAWECRAPRSQDRGLELHGQLRREPCSGLSHVEARLIEFKTQEIKFCKKIRGHEFDVEVKNNKIENLMNELEKVKKDKEGLDSKLTGFESASKDLDTLLGSQRTNKNKEGLGYNAVPPFMLKPSPSIESNSSDLQKSNSSVSEHGESSCSIMSKPMIKFVNAVRTQSRVLRVSTADLGNKGKAVKASACWIWRPKQNTTEKGYWDSGCSRHMTGNIFYLSVYDPYDGGYVSFGQGGGKITENKLIEKGAGPNWLFDIDTLTNSMNYVPVVVARTSSTNISGTKDAASQGVNKNVSSLRYIALPNWFHEAHMEFSSSDAQDAYNADVIESSGNSNPTATSKIPLANQMETLTVESVIPTVSSPIPTACLDTSPETTSGSRLISKEVISQEETPSLDNILNLSNRFEDILGDTKNTVDTNGVEVDLSNLKSSISASPTPTFRIHKDHPKSQTISPVDTPEEPKKIFDAHKDPSWVEAMQEELLQFKIQNVWILVDCPKGEEGIDYEEVFAPVIRIEAIRLFLAYASFMGFIVYQMDVKIAFLYGTIDEEVYVMQPPEFQDPEFPDRVYKVEKAMYGLHQAPRAWYGTLSKYMLDNGFQKGTIDQTLFIRKHTGDFLLVQVYVDDIIFGSSNPQLCREFKALMHEKFQMSAMGELNFFLGLQVLQKKDGIFLSQHKYTIVATSTTEAEYVVAASGYGQVLWIQNQMLDYGLAFCDYHNMIAILEKSEHNIDFYQILDFIKASNIRYALTINPTVYVSHIRQFWSTARIETTNEGTKILATIDGKPRNISESSITRNLKLNDEEEISTLPNAELFENHEHASLSKDDSQGEAFPTVTSLDAGQARENIIKTSTLPHESTPRVTSLDADEGSMQQQLQELMDLWTGLQRVKILKDKDRGNAEPSGDDAPIKGRSMEIKEGVRVERSTELGSNDTKEMVNVLSAIEAANILTSRVVDVSVPPVAEVSTIGVPTVSGLVPTVSAIFTTANVVTTYSRRPREILAKDKVAKEIEEEMAREDQRMNEKIARDAEIARIHAEEELKMLIDSLDRNN
uniref:Reverse transcriptase Ty1/copia-type domain-containing protein n=1 Tax=Tanacetum cinerariifolium TaxID=118510 RepID=A0A6L2LUP7_TANCI|nr:hypothetical protein [Tanacetum cinerariifolium]